MDPQQPSQPPFSQPPPFGSHQDPRNASLPSLSYPGAPSLGQPRPSSIFDPLGRREQPPPPPPPPPRAPSYPYVQNAASRDAAIQQPALSPNNFGPRQHDGSNGYHSRQSSLGAGVPQREGGVMDHKFGFKEDSHAPSATGPVHHHTAPLPRQYSSQPPQPIVTDASHMIHSSDLSRRHSSGGGGTPPRLQAGPHETSLPPPPSSYNNRQMLPPTSPQQFKPNHASNPRAPPLLPTTFNTGRDLPSLSSITRPESSMSISSMLGSDTDRPLRESAPQVSGYGRGSVSATSASPALQAVSAMSPPPATSRQPSTDYSLLQRSRTPDKTPFTKLQGTRPYRSSSGGASILLENARFGATARSQPFQLYEDQSRGPSIAAISAVSDTQQAQSRRLSLNGPVQRPNSQPQSEEGSRSSYIGLLRSSGIYGEGSTSTRTSFGGILERDNHETQEGRQYPTPGGYRDRVLQQQSDREREGSLFRDTASRFPPQQPQSIFVQQEREKERAEPVASWANYHSQPTSPESRRIQSSEQPVNRLFASSTQEYTSSLGSPFTQVSRPGSGLQLQPRQGQVSVLNDQNASNDPNRSKPRPFSPFGVTAPQHHVGGLASEDQPRKGSDELSQQRALLSVSADGKKGGRLSPLPQAVQGAQAQILGPGGQPGIKDDHGRIFSGIGSGVGNTSTAGSQSFPLPTSYGGSPFRRDKEYRSALSEANDIGGSRMSRPSSGAGKKARRTKEDDNKAESENGEGLGTPFVAASRATKRAARPHQHQHQHHHHHHHGPGSHHHHRSRKVEDYVSVNGPPRSSSSLSAFNPARRTSTPSDGFAATPTAPGHHHHHHPHHHHHHPSKPSALSSAPVRKATKILELKSIMTGVADLPRAHLGSMLYDPKIEAALGPTSNHKAPYGFTVTPKPIPWFDGKANCTYTIRVPRHFLTPRLRESICARRFLWGTGVYTDDSDPVAVAIHCGLIRGEWSDDVDVNLLGLESTNEQANGTKGSTEVTEGVLTNRTPVLPPADKDLHITLLILPPLEKYDPSIMYGIKSRKWSSNHDGMSFKIKKIEWVDDGAGKGEERTGEARRKRLRHMMSSGRMCTGSGAEYKKARLNALIAVRGRSE